MRKTLFSWVSGLAALPVLFLLQGCTQAVDPVVCDLAIYGGTPAGMCAAEAAANEGLNVVVIEPTGHLGGMMSSGLCASDQANESVLGGLTRKVFERIGREYDTDLIWRFEPHVAERVFDTMAAHTNIQVIHHRRVEKVIKDGAAITRMVCDQGVGVDANMFIDASYEGDLMARAGVAYTVGRESRDTYNESYAGVQPRISEGQWSFPIKGRDPDGSLRPEIQTAPRGKDGDGDHKVQAYNVRVCITKDPDNRVPFTKPRGYDEDRYLLLGKYVEAAPDTWASTIFHFLTLPNDKIDLNSFGPFSSDYLGASWDYPDAGYRKRAKIVEAHKRYTQGLLYFLCTNERVPDRMKEVFSSFGYARDEFVDNGNWPYQLYVREGRRMQGEYIMTQKDVLDELTKPDAVGMGSHYIECHHVQRRLNKDGFVQNQGGLRVRVNMTPYQLPYRSIVPREQDCSNLLVPVCMSASHVAYNSIRMEPQYMILGHAAGLAAAQALEESASVQRISIKRLQAKLMDQGQVLAWGQPE